MATAQDLAESAVLWWLLILATTLRTVDAKASTGLPAVVYQLPSTTLPRTPPPPAVACGQRSPDLANVGPYIVGGRDAQPGAWPWQVILRLYGAFHCGGAIISDSWVLTAAHCVADGDSVVSAADLQVVAGTVWRETFLRTDSSVTQTRAVDTVTVQPTYNDNEFHDLALLHVASPFTYTDYVRPVCLPSPSLDVMTLSSCATTGFGLTNAAQYTQGYRLQQVQTTVLYTSGVTLYVSLSQCFGDSGSPLVCRDDTGAYTVVGVVKFVGDNTCHLPDGDTAVQQFSDWIASVTATADVAVTTTTAEPPTTTTSTTPPPLPTTTSFEDEAPTTTTTALPVPITPIISSLPPTPALRKTTFNIFRTTIPHRTSLPDP